MLAVFSLKIVKLIPSALKELVPFPMASISREQISFILHAVWAAMSGSYRTSQNRYAFFTSQINSTFESLMDLSPS